MLTGLEHGPAEICDISGVFVVAADGTNFAIQRYSPPRQRVLVSETEAWGALMKYALLVDDDRHVLSITRRYLADAGFDVEISDGFPTAAFQLKAHQPDLLVVDVRLGEFNGLQLAILAREHWSKVPIVIMSGWDDPVLKHDAAQCGAVYMCKPFDSKGLLNAIRQAEEIAQVVPSTQNRTPKPIRASLT